MEAKETQAYLTNSSMGALKQLYFELIHQVDEHGSQRPQPDRKSPNVCRNKQATPAEQSGKFLDLLE
ncbi:hypothetical protein [Pseudomonas knackmussii]|uniref:hypothetical protein n=1 Tax=Pseudomonas knackmussii TaxID=65741 RepID=UPI003F4A83EC